MLSFLWGILESKGGEGGDLMISIMLPNVTMAVRVVIVSYSFCQKRQNYYHHMRIAFSLSLVDFFNDVYL